jgi:REP element-mobilizing transposase RayT
MPRELLDKWRNEDLTDAAFRRKVERYLDAGYGKCWLRETRVASLVQDSLIYLDEKSYRLISWVIMPNHVHVLFTPNPETHLDDILHSFKSFTAHKANKLLGRTGQFWQHESFDRYVRDKRHFRSVIKYIENNPVKAKLCKKATDWLFGSARLRNKCSNE